MTTRRSTRTLTEVARSGPTVEFCERVRTNAYRLLGVSAGATHADVVEAAGLLTTRAPTRCLTGSTDTAPVVTDRALIRDAVVRLSSPAERCLERLLGFLSHSAARGTTSEASRAVNAVCREHDTSLVALLTRFRVDPQLSAHDEWVRALRRWQERLPELEAVLHELEAANDGPGQATIEEIRSALDYAGELPLRAVAGVGHVAALTGDWQRVGAAAFIVGEAALDEQQSDRLHRQLLNPVADSAEGLCRAVAASAEATRTPAGRSPAWADVRSRLLRKWYRRRIEPELVRLRRIGRAAGRPIARVEAVERSARHALGAVRTALGRSRETAVPRNLAG